MLTTQIRGVVPQHKAETSGIYPTDFVFNRTDQPEMVIPQIDAIEATLSDTIAETHSFNTEVATDTTIYPSVLHTLLVLAGREPATNLQQQTNLPKPEQQTLAAHSMELHDLERQLPLFEYGARPNRDTPFLGFGRNLRLRGSIALDIFRRAYPNLIYPEISERIENNRRKLTDFAQESIFSKSFAALAKSNLNLENLPLHMWRFQTVQLLNKFFNFNNDLDFIYKDSQFPFRKIYAEKTMFGNKIKTRTAKDGTPVITIGSIRSPNKTRMPHNAPYIEVVEASKSNTNNGSLSKISIGVNQLGATDFIGVPLIRDGRFVQQVHTTELPESATPNERTRRMLDLSKAISYAVINESTLETNRRETFSLRDTISDFIGRAKTVPTENISETSKTLVSQARTFAPLFIELYKSMYLDSDEALSFMNQTGMISGKDIDAYRDSVEKVKDFDQKYFQFIKIIAGEENYLDFIKALFVFDPSVFSTTLVYNSELVSYVHDEPSNIRFMNEIGKENALWRFRDGFVKRFDRGIAFKRTPLYKH